MTRWARLGICSLALAAAGLAAASGPLAAGGADNQGSEKRHVRIAHGTRGGGYLGLQLEDVSSEDVDRLKLEAERGALVREVVEDSPAAQAGLKSGDVVLRYQDEPVKSAAQLARLVRETPVGRTVPLELSRDGAIQTLSVTPGERASSWHRALLPELGMDLALPEPPEPPEAPEAPEAPELLSPGMGKLLEKNWGNWARDWGKGFRFEWAGQRKLGIEYQEISGQLARYFKLPDESGVLVIEVVEDGPAAKAGLRAGDVILALDGKEIREGHDLRRAVDEAEAGRQVAVKVQREGRPLDLNVALAERPRARERRKAVTS
jgi:serine protease Do